VWFVFEENTLWLLPVYTSEEQFQADLDGARGVRLLGDRPQR
jgi:hypothetical protein